MKPTSTNEDFNRGSNASKPTWVVLYHLETAAIATVPDTLGKAASAVELTLGHKLMEYKVLSPAKLVINSNIFCVLNKIFEKNIFTEVVYDTYPGTTQKQLKIL